MCYSVQTMWRAGLFCLKTSVEVEAQGHHSLPMHESPAARAIDTTGGSTTNTNGRQPVICTLEGAGTHLCNGTLGLQPHTALVLNSSCRDVHFCNVNFTGAHIYLPACLLASPGKLIRKKCDFLGRRAHSVWSACFASRGLLLQNHLSWLQTGCLLCASVRA